MLVEEDEQRETVDRLTPVRVMIISISIVFIVAMSVLVYPQFFSPSDDNNEEEREYYSGEPGDYYGFGIGPRYITGCNAGLINEDYGLLDLLEYDELPIYTLSPPKLETKQDAVEYLADIAFDVSDYSYYYNDNYTKGHVFWKRPMSISVELSGAISVHVASPSPPLWQPNITTEEAMAIAIGYMENHTGLPEGAVTDIHHDNVGNSAGDRCITSFWIHFYRNLDGFDFAASGGHANHIIIEVDAYYSRVVWFQYAWADLVRTDMIGPEELEDLASVVDRYVRWHNELWGERIGGDAPVLNITGASIEYRPPFGMSASQMYEGSPRYVYLPHIRIEVGNGFAYMSPLVVAEEE